MQGIILVTIHQISRSPCVTFLFFFFFNSPSPPELFFFPALHLGATLHHYKVERCPLSVWKCVRFYALIEAAPDCVHLSESPLI